MGLTVFGIPNETLKQLAAKMIPDAYADIYKIDGRIFDINRELVRFARRGEWQSFIDIVSGIVKENFAVRDAVEGEKVVQSTLVTLLCAAGGPYFVRHERESGGPGSDAGAAREDKGRGSRPARPVFRFPRPRSGVALGASTT